METILFVGNALRKIDISDPDSRDSTLVVSRNVCVMFSLLSIGLIFLLKRRNSYINTYFFIPSSDSLLGGTPLAETNGSAFNVCRNNAYAHYRPNFLLIVS